ncbi:RNA polymerase sigma-70 factor [uncultured Bacteroides sp.]|uniref:RNA polymerase sigma-70 factor n=1 Tax=uncultured Bacteroides sp. TaxID=162156 RepID=UPI0025EE121B|nr:RNA polymerase sigma-70 factor [uncultured Bacteroides sp.]
MKSTLSEDTSLLFAMQKGDRKAFDKLFQKYYPILCTYGYRFVRLEDAEEIVQDIMLWLWENRETPVIEYSLKQYLFKSVYHRSMTRIVQNEVKLRVDTAFHDRMFGKLEDVDVFQINEMSKHIQQAINELPESYREAFIMNRFQSLSYKEVAEILNVSPKTIDYRIQQSLKILRVKLKDYLPLLLILLSYSPSSNHFN